MAKKYALIIGIDAYQDSSFTPLKKAKADADGIEALLRGSLHQYKNWSMKITSLWAAALKTSFEIQS